MQFYITWWLNDFNMKKGKHLNVGRKEKYLPDVRVE